MSKPIRKAIGPAMALLLLAGCDAAQDAADSAGTAGSAVEAASGELTQPSIEALLNGAANPGASGGTGDSAAESSSAGSSSTAPELQPRAEAPSSSSAAAAPSSETTGAPAPSTAPAPATTETTAAAPTTAAPTTEPPPSTTASTEAPPVVAAPVNPAPSSPISSDPLPAAAAEFLALLNQVRAGQGLAPLSADGRLVASATGQVDNMISTAGLFHQSLADELSQGWSIVGENVGYGPNVPVIHQALVNSPGHYQNLVNTRYTHVGIAVVTDGSGRMWVAQVFGG